METKKEYLRRILKVTKDDVGYSEMDTFMKEYNNFIKAFNFDEIRDGEIERIFVDFHSKGITPANLVALKKGKSGLEEQLFYYSQKAKEYFETDIKGKRYKEICKTNRAKDIDIVLTDLERNHSLTGSLKDLDEFLHNLDAQWNNFINNLYAVVDLIFSGRYENRPVKSNEFNQVVEDEISYYRGKVKEYEKTFKEPEFYYTGKNDNPYKNIFLYCLNSYIRNFYSIDIITMQPGHEGKLTMAGKPEQKEKYTLEDVAKAYATMSGETYEKVYGKIKQQFKKSPFMQKKKNGRFYEFDCIEIPLATYIYYSKKNHSEPDFSEAFNAYDKFITHFYAPLLRANMYGEYEGLRAFNKYAEFVNAEFKKLTNIVNDAYLVTWLEELFLTSFRLRFRCLKFPAIEELIEGKIL